MTEQQQIKPGFKPSPLGSIPSDWDVKEMGQIFDFKNGINAGKESYGSGVKFINVMEVIYNDAITADIIPGTVQISDEQKKLYLVKNGDVLFNRTSETTNEIGLTATYYGNDDVVFGGFVIRGRPKDKSVDDVFKRYCFRSTILRNQIIKGGQGAIRTNVGQSDLEKVKVLLPPLPEQRAIAACLSTWDQAIIKVQALLAQKELRKKWLMQQLLTGKKRLKGFESKWIKCTANDFLTPRNEQNPHDGKIPLFSLTIEDGVTEKSERYEREFLVKDKSIKKYKIVYPNDIVFNPANLRWGAIAKNNCDIKVLLSPIYEVMSVKNGYNVDFVSYLVSAPRQISYYASIVEGTLIERMAVKAEPFLATKYFIPEMQEQTAIARVLQAADKEIQLLKAKVNKLKEEKKGLMQQLLTGNKRLTIK